LGRLGGAPPPPAEDDDVTFTEDDIKPDKLTEEEARRPLQAFCCGMCFPPGPLFTLQLTRQGAARSHNLPNEAP